LKVGCGSFGLPHTDFDVLEGIIWDGSAVPEAFNDELAARIFRLYGS
jgi:hypothetical protein